MSSRRDINNLGDVQIALQDLFNQMDKLRTQSQDYQGRIVTGVADAKKPTDAVNLQIMQSYVKQQIDIIAKTIPPKTPQQPLNAGSETFKTILPEADSTFSIGSTILKWLKGWFVNLNISSLTASKPLRSDGSKNITTGNLNIATEVTGVLPIANGGTNSNTAAAARTALSAAVSGANGDITSLTGLTTAIPISEGGTGANNAPNAAANLNVVVAGVFPGGATVVLAKLTALGANGSLIVNSNGDIVTYNPPT